LDFVDRMHARYTRPAVYVRLVKVWGLVLPVSPRTAPCVAKVSAIGAAARR
jgi:hypothetical protein